VKQNPYKLRDHCIAGPGIRIYLETEIVKELNFLANTISAYQDIVSSYRFGRRPAPEKSLDVVAKFHERVRPKEEE
jgi:hypothetical protein